MPSRIDFPANGQYCVQQCQRLGLTSTELYLVAAYSLKKGSILSMNRKTMTSYLIAFNLDPERRVAEPHSVTNSWPKHRNIRLPADSRIHVDL